MRPTERSESATPKRFAIFSLRSAQRQRTTPSATGSGCFSTILSNWISWSSFKRGLRPEHGRSSQDYLQPPSFGRCQNANSTNIFNQLAFVDANYLASDPYPFWVVE